MKKVYLVHANQQNHAGSVIRWCHDNLPVGSWRYCGYAKFEFDCEKNQTIFALKWA